MSNHDIASLILEEMRYRGLAYVDTYCPTYIASIGAHIFNVENRLRAEHFHIPRNTIVETDEEKASRPETSALNLLRQSKARKEQEKIRERLNKAHMTGDSGLSSLQNITKYPEWEDDREEWLAPYRMMFGRAQDSRAHILYVTPPGFGKTLWVEQLSDSESGILKHTPIRPVLQGSITEPGWVGTVNNKNGEYEIVPGESAIHSKSIHGSEEFHAITASMDSGHSPTMLDQMLMSLDSGRVVKRLAGGKIHFNTSATLQTASQPEKTRLRIDSGIARRLNFMLFIPNEADKKKFRRAYWAAMSIYPNIKRTSQVRDMITEKILLLKDVKRIDFDMPTFMEYGDKNDIPHFEVELLNRLAIGWTVMTQPINEYMKIKLTSEIETLMSSQMKWRNQIKYGSSLSQVKIIMESHGGEMHQKDLVDEMIAYHSFTADSASKVIDDMVKQNILYIAPATKKVKIRGYKTETKAVLNKTHNDGLAELLDDKEDGKQ